MSKINFLKIAVVGLLLINIALVSFVFTRKMPPPNKQMNGQAIGPKNLIIDRLHFDKEQIAQYDKIIVQHQRSINSLNDSMHKAKNELYQKLADKNNTGEEAIIAKMGALQQQIERTHYNHFAALRSLCKPQQINDFNNLTKDLAYFFSAQKKDAPLPKD